MKTSCQIAILVIAALVAATPCPPAATVTVTFGKTNSISALSAVTSAPEAGSTATDGSGNYMTIAVTNVYGNHLSLSFDSNAGGPSPVGNPPATTLPDNAFTHYAFPTGQPKQGNTPHGERMRTRNIKSHLPGRSASSSFRHRHRHYSPRYVIDG